jgi:uncharacterized coiled-coil protein SlyX
MFLKSVLTWFNFMEKEFIKKVEKGFAQIFDQLKNLTRRMDSVEKTSNLIYKDRDLLEEISIRIGTQEDTIRHLSTRVADLEKNLKADNKEISKKVEDMAEKVEDLS